MFPLHTYSLFIIARGRDLLVKAPAWGYSAQLLNEDLIHSTYLKVTTYVRPV